MGVNYCLSNAFALKNVNLMFNYIVCAILIEINLNFALSKSWSAQ